MLLAHSKSLSTTFTERISKTLFQISAIVDQIPTVVTVLQGLHRPVAGQRSAIGANVSLTLPSSLSIRIPNDTYSN